MLIYAPATGSYLVEIGLIALAAVINGALIRTIMASRVCCGMARQGWIPEVLGKVNTRTRTPFAATLAVSGTVLPVALAVTRENAGAASLLLLVVFALVKLTPVGMQRKPGQPCTGFSVPRRISLGGFLSSSAWLADQTCRSRANEKGGTPRSTAPDYFLCSVIS